MTDAPIDLETAPTFTIARLDLRPGDVLVVKAPMALNRAQGEGLRGWLEKSVPADCKVLILDNGIDLAVMTEPEREACPECLVPAHYPECSRAKT